MKREIALTEDGSSSIYIPEMNEHYHSYHGAIQEANHVFIEHGVSLIKKNELTVFEVGFGTGLNAMLTAIYAKEKNVKVNYYGIEAFPLESELLEQLNYSELVSDSNNYWRMIHKAEWGVEERISDCFLFTKIHEKIQLFDMPTKNFDIIYFDAFGPRVQSEMWNPMILKKMFESLKAGGLFVTYCAQGQMKRDLKEIGFTIQSYPGPPGKREMTVAIKG